MTSKYAVARVHAPTNLQILPPAHATSTLLGAKLSAKHAPICAARAAEAECAAVAFKVFCDKLDDRRREQRARSVPDAASRPTRPL